MRNILISKMHGTLFTICEQCDCLFTYDEEDIYDINNVYCPQCKWINHVNYYKNYDGIIKNQDFLEEKTNKS